MRTLPSAAYYLLKSRFLENSVGKVYRRRKTYKKDESTTLESYPINPKRLTPRCIYGKEVHCQVPIGLITFQN